MKKTTTLNPNAIYGLRVIIMCQRSSISCNLCTTLAGMLITGEAIHLWGQSTWQIFVPSEFCYEPKTAIKKIKS